MTKECAFKYYIYADTASATLATDELITDTASRYFPSTVPAWVKEGKITRVSYRLNPTAAVTYQLFILEGSAAGDYAQGSKILYASAAARADDTQYDDYSERAFMLDTVGRIYYVIDWSGAPGDTTGYIVVEGVAYYG